VEKKLRTIQQSKHPPHGEKKNGFGNFSNKNPKKKKLRLRVGAKNDQSGLQSVS
jgi:hypothetical protein